MKNLKVQVLSEEEMRDIHEAANKMAAVMMD